MKNKQRIIIIFIGLLIITLTSIWALKTFFYEPTPTISVDYGPKIDELTRPKNYNPDDNAAPIIEEALKSFKGVFIPYSTNKNMQIQIDGINPEKVDHLKKWVKSNEASLTLAAQAA